MKYLQIHLPEQRVAFDLLHQKTVELKADDSLCCTQLMEFFLMNTLAEKYEKKGERFPWQYGNTPKTLITKDPRNYFYLEFLEHFT